MLENIIGQKGIVKNLKHEFNTGIIPRAMLFYGPEYSGKLSTALEVARVLTCKKKTGNWNCGCSNCKKQRMLNYPYLQILGSRYFNIEIQASSDTLKRTNKKASKYLFIRSVKKLLKRFDPVFWEGNDALRKKAGTEVEEIEEKLDLIDPDMDNKQFLDKTVDSITEKCLKLNSLIKSDNISISSIRKIIYWAHVSSSGNKKIVILEGADKMQEASQNALLKLLEEPPIDVILILITTQKSALLQTVLSRLRTYRFYKRSEIEQLDVLKRIFREESEEYRTLLDYFLAWKNINPNGIKNLAHKFLNQINGKEDNNILNEMDEILKSESPNESIRLFFQELLSAFREFFVNEKYGIGIIDKWSKMIHLKVIKIERLNLNPALVLESIFYIMRNDLSRI